KKSNFIEADLLHHAVVNVIAVMEEIDTVLRIGNDGDHAAGSPNHSLQLNCGNLQPGNARRKIRMAGARVARANEGGKWIAAVRQLGEFSRMYCGCGNGHASSGWLGSGNDRLCFFLRRSLCRSLVGGMAH